MISLPLETDRLRLRAFTPADVPAMEAVYLDEEVMRYVAGGPFAGRAAVEEALDREARSQQTRGFAFWAVVERATGEVVGDAGFGVFEPLGELELGYTLARAAWGKGLATEAARACVRAAFEHLDVARIVAVVDRDNAASLRVAERLDMRRCGETTVHDRPHVLFELARSVSRV